ncbi:MAG: RCC1 repeat-containing protein, partial [Lentisphaerota bacterium]
LGDANSKVSTATQVPIANDPFFMEVDASLTHSLALDEEGKVYTWGSNINGDLGLGTSGNNVASPLQMSGLPPMRKIATGYFHSLGIAQNGRLWTWGSGWDGQLGVGAASTGYKPMATRLDQVIGIAAGTRHSVALKSDGTVWAWGLNTCGQVGNNTQGNNLALPTQVLANAQAVAAGFSCTYALMNDGTVMAWGLNDTGQLGNGTRVNQKIPTLVPGLTEVVKLAAYGNGAMALKADGSLWIWGGNGNGQLGDNGVVDSLVPIPVAGAMNLVPDVNIHLGPGGWHNLIALGNGDVYSWGANHSDQLGYSSPQNPHRQPVTAVPDGLGGIFNLLD